MIEIADLTKYYGPNLAVDHLNFKLESCKIYGFLGPNGAGKSTTLNMITGCLAPSEGSVRINGYDIVEQPLLAKRLIGYLPEIPPVYTDRTPVEYLRFVAESKGVARGSVNSEIERVLNLTQTENVSQKLIRNLSKGYRQRVGIAQAIIGNPEIIILDEPTVGLDPQQIIDIRELIKSLGEKHTVFISSHILSEIQMICDNVLIISDGKLVYTGTSEDLEKAFTLNSVIRITALSDKEKTCSTIASVISNAAINVLSHDEEKTSAEITVDADDIDEILRSLFFAFAKNNTALIEMNAEKSTLENIFIQLLNEEGSNENSIQA